MMAQIMEAELFNAGIGYESAPPHLDVGHVEDVASTALARLTRPALQRKLPRQADTSKVELLT